MLERRRVKPHIKNKGELGRFSPRSAIALKMEAFGLSTPSRSNNKGNASSMMNLLICNICGATLAAHEF